MPADHKFNINKTTYNIYKYTAMLSCAVIFLLGMTFLQPFSFTNSANAEGASLDMFVTLNPTISIWTTDTSNNTSNTVDIAVNPDASVATGTIRTHVSTNNLTGYTLTIHSNSNDSTMIRNNTDTTNTIKPLTGSGISTTNWNNNSDLNNMWGYSINNNDSFLGIPNNSTSSTITSTSKPILDSYTDTTFGTKVDLDLPADTYSNTVVFSAVANTNPTLFLQDMTTSDCAALDVYDSSRPGATTYTRYDRRDGQSYRIRRLYMTADKIDSPSTTACWMVDNLKVTKDTIEAAGNSAKLSSDTSNVADNSEFELTASDDSEWCANTSLNCINQPMLINTSYGTLYSWYVATASTGSYALRNGDTATSSICPGKGITSSSTWHLPASQEATNGWYRLFRAYQDNYGWTSIDGSNNVVTNNLSTTIGPDLVYSGLHSGANTGGQGSNGYGYWWTQTAGPYNDGAYSAHISNQSVRGGTSIDYKYYGFAVRCILPATTE